MIKPETSTSVATNGADDVAGSSPTRRSKNGSIEPASDPHSTIPTRANPTVTANKNQCSPYELNSKCQTEMRITPIVPKIAPSDRPDKISRRITRHQSCSVTSPNAIARMIRVEACEPELPPLEITNGTKMDNTTAFAISFSKRLIAVAVSISLRNKMINQEARFFTMLGIAIFIYGSSNASE